MRIKSERENKKKGFPKNIRRTKDIKTGDAGRESKRRRGQTGPGSVVVVEKQQAAAAAEAEAAASVPSAVKACSIDI